MKLWQSLRESAAIALPFLLASWFAAIITHEAEASLWARAAGLSAFACFIAYLSPVLAEPSLPDSERALRGPTAVECFDARKRFQRITGHLVWICALIGAVLLEA
jgi:hypothetical protein